MKDPIDATQVVSLRHNPLRSIAKYTISVLVYLWTLEDPTSKVDLHCRALAVAVAASLVHEQVRHQLLAIPTYLLYHLGNNHLYIRAYMCAYSRTASEFII